MRSHTDGLQTSVNIGYQQRVSLGENERGWRCFHGWEEQCQGKEHGKEGQGLRMTTVKTDGHVGETGLPVRDLVEVVLPQGKYVNGQQERGAKLPILQYFWQPSTQLEN